MHRVTPDADGFGEVRKEVGGVPDSRFHAATHISRLLARALLSAELVHVGPGF
jgi:hypothetical protein